MHIKEDAYLSVVVFGSWCRVSGGGCGGGVV